MPQWMLFFPLSRDRLTFPQHEKEGLKPHRVGELLFVSFAEANFIVDISETIDKKIKALSLHKSQFENFKEVEERIRERSKNGRQEKKDIKQPKDSKE